MQRSSSAVLTNSFASGDQSDDEDPRSGIRMRASAPSSIRVTPRTYRVVNGVVEFIKVLPQSPQFATAR